MSAAKYTTHEYGGYCHKPGHHECILADVHQSPEASISTVGISNLLDPHTVAFGLILFSAEVFDCFI
jgi:hypothetical protein